MTNELISCELHDYIEVVCMYRYQIRLVLKDDSTIEGKARDILTTPDKRSFCCWRQMAVRSKLN